MDGKKWIALLLALVMSVSLFACGAQPETNDGDDQHTGDKAVTRVFIDSCGREVTVPANVEKVAVSGPLAQIVVFAMAPDKLVGIANAWDESAAQFLDTKYYDLPLLGQLYGGKGEMNLETLLAAAPDVVIDVGEPKGSIVEDMDALQERHPLRPHRRLPRRYGQHLRHAWRPAGHAQRGAGSGGLLPLRL